MRLKWAQQSPELQHLFPRVDPDPSGDGDGGGGDDEPLREPGKKALAAERQRAEDLEKKVTRLERQAKAFEGLNPDAYREALEKHRQAEERLQELETIANARAMEKEQTYTKQLQESKTREATLAKQLQEIQVKGAVRDAFLAIGGKREKDGAGRVPFDLFMAATGASYALDESGDVYVVDAKGAPVINENGRVPLADWVEQQADSSSVLGVLFDPKSRASGSGMGSDRGPGGKRVVDIHSMSRAELGEYAFRET
jgi:hypothetical protein